MSTQPKPVVAAPSEAAIRALRLSGKVDRLGDLLNWYRAVKPKLDELDDLKKEFRKVYENHPAAETLRVSGDRWLVDLTARDEKRRITDPKKAFEALRKALGIDQLREELSYTFKLLDQHVSEDEQEKFVVKERTGTREFSAVLATPADAR